jgi:hypothetical protein
MEQFKESEAYQEIKKEFHYLEIEKQTANFDCYVDGLFCYYYRQDDYFLHEFSIISDDIMLSNMPILELLDLKRVKYFSHAVYDISIPNSHEKLIVKKEWTKGDNKYFKDVMDGKI